MANRTTAAEVRTIMNLTESDLPDATADAFIGSANAMITALLGSSTLGSTLLAQIEMWLAAHMIASTQFRMAKKEGAGGASIEYTGQYGIGLDSTSYGQMAKSLDTTGHLSQAGRRAASMIAIKEEYS